MEDLKVKMRDLEIGIKSLIEDFINKTDKAPIITIEIEELKTKCSRDNSIKLVSVKAEVLIQQSNNDLQRNTTTCRSKELS